MLVNYASDLMVFPVEVFPGHILPDEHLPVVFAVFVRQLYYVVRILDRILTNVGRLQSNSASAVLKVFVPHLVLLYFVSLDILGLVHHAGLKPSLDIPAVLVSFRSVLLTVFVLTFVFALGSSLAGAVSPFPVGSLQVFSQKSVQHALVLNVSVPYVRIQLPVPVAAVPAAILPQFVVQLVLLALQLVLLALQPIAPALTSLFLPEQNGS